MKTKYEKRSTINGIDIFKVYSNGSEERLHPPHLALHNKENWIEAKDFLKEDIGKYF